ncbi:YdeI/OmpD-associated family protein [Psychroserpens sp.]|uniref:YdeI/OmpD-associated family protein n=1 Tax=Psychroserpens sp. TaxID=2020870 RepID=UPI001B19CFE7|nr:YdeI/OmpD-associated family protein [Psychroserpens sp.]MBO6607024.1 YdeI/OmpD-associated family protein [Psychroserpens sp.]MBO6631471.1 YdeI/OmpD-associated family protein [Psychroserpens sp.]MBO6654170.1 YdeI/OmpD-associated family protein [Psychroserpens sp.]MBO6682544.1 YdeI/OmpD-associated family protein [Psychroserpens sp.]MBO6750796.1 YdeI/OmpD-associated family protein [Psychroserpens sp.]
MELYFKTDHEWRSWLEQNYNTSSGVYLIFYKLENKEASMRWEEAVKVALCFGWIDSTVKSLGNGKRRQYFCPRKAKSVWSALNKSYIKDLIHNNLMHESGLKSIEVAQSNGSWTALDDVENGIIPDDLKLAFDKHPEAFTNYNGFARSYRKSYLYWLHQAKRPNTRQNRIDQIIEFCLLNKKSRD